MRRSIWTAVRESAGQRKTKTCWFCTLELHMEARRATGGIPTTLWCSGNYSRVGSTDKIHRAGSRRRKRELAPQTRLELTTRWLIAHASECRVFFRSESKQESSWVFNPRLDLGVNRKSFLQRFASRNVFW